MTNEQQRREFYAKRIGTVYGVWKVINVEYCKGAERDQLWTLQCVKCGKVKTTRSCRAYIKGRMGHFCECMREKAEKQKKPTFAENMNQYQGEIIDGWKIVRYEIGRGFLCECEKCGRLSYKSAKQLLGGRAPKCLCRLHQTKYDETWIGRKYAHLTIVNVIAKKCKDNKIRSYFECACDCGNKCDVLPIRLIKYSKKCCGVECKYNNEKNKLEYGSQKHPLYSKWQNMKSRCENEKNDSYKYYGARGIKVCDEWQGREGFYRFFKWSLENGWEDGLTIDRINPDGNYEPSNCRYITLSENSSLARHSINGGRKTKYADILVNIDGKQCSIKEAVELSGVLYESVLYRVSKKGMTWQEAFDELIEKNKQKEYILKKYGIKMR